MSTQEKIRTFITTELGLDISNVQNEDPLFTSGLIDSFAFIEMLSFLESELNCKIDLAELSLDDLDTIDALAKINQ